MYRMTARIAAAACLVLGASARADDIVFQQTPILLTTSGLTSSFSPIDGGFRSYDSFTLNTGTNIQAVRWTAFYYDAKVPTNNPTGIIATSFDISFYADNAGAPGAQLSNNNVPIAAVTSTLVATNPFNNATVKIYQFDASLSTPFRAEAGKKYWFSVLSKQSASFVPIMGWVDGKGGDALTYQQQLNPDATAASVLSRSGDRAFALFGVNRAELITVGGPWYEFLFHDVNSSPETCTSCAGSVAGDSLYAPSAPWIFTAPTNGALLTVTDVQQAGDAFNVLDFGTAIGSTPSVVVSAAPVCGIDPTTCSTNPNVSHSVFTLAPGPHSITLTVKTTSASTAGLGFFRVDPAQAIPAVNAIVNGATFTAKGAAPNSFVSFFGLNFGSLDTPSNIFPATTFNGISVLFNGTPAPLYFVFGTAGQMNLVLPSELPESGTVTVQVKNTLGTSSNFALKMASSDVGMFRITDPSNSKRNNGAVLFANTAWRVMPASMAAALGFPSCVGAIPATNCGQPAAAGDVLQIYLTGLGKATPGGDPNGKPLATGTVAPASGNPLYITVKQPSVTIGGIAAQVFFSGVTPGNAALYQLNVALPPGVQPGDDVPVVVTTTDGSTDTVTIAVRTI